MREMFHVSEFEMHSIRIHIVIIYVYSGFYTCYNRMVQTIAYYNLIKFVMFRVCERCLVFFVCACVHVCVFGCHAFVVYESESMNRGYGCLKWNKIQIMHVLCRFCVWDRLLTLFLIKFATILLHYRLFRFLFFRNYPSLSLHSLWHQQQQTNGCNENQRSY